MGFFTQRKPVASLSAESAVAIPFRVGWGFSLYNHYAMRPGSFMHRRNPFQGGMGFFTPALKDDFDAYLAVAIPFRVGWGFSPFGMESLVS